MSFLAYNLFTARDTCRLLEIEPPKRRICAGPIASQMPLQASAAGIYLQFYQMAGIRCESTFGLKDALRSSAVEATWPGQVKHIRRINCLCEAYFVASPGSSSLQLHDDPSQRHFFSQCAITDFRGSVSIGTAALIPQFRQQDYSLPVGEQLLHSQYQYGRKQHARRRITLLQQCDSELPQYWCISTIAIFCASRTSSSRTSQSYLAYSL